MGKKLTSIDWLVREARESGKIDEEAVLLAKRKAKDETIQFCKDWYYANTKCTAPINPEDYWDEINENI